ncbi:MAG: hypothetical protein IPM48_13830 [Saprospiraceae bacterium]|nr:hypothetical protein [Saprospiraceae bacterium]
MVRINPLLFVIPFLYSNLNLGQNIATDSVGLSTQDSLKNIQENAPLQMTILFADKFHPMQPQEFDWKNLDTLEWLISPYRTPGYIQTNNFGSPLQTSRDQLQFNGHMDEGYHITDLGHQQADRLLKIRSNKPLTELLLEQSLFPGSSQSGLINNLSIHTLISIPFRKSFHYNFYYNRINYSGIYTNNQNYISSLVSTLHWEGKTHHRKVEFNIASNTDKLQYNFGVKDPNQLTDPRYALRESVPVFSSSANSRLKNGQIGLVYFTDLFQRKNRIIHPSVNISAYYHYNTIQFIDNNPSNILEKYGRDFYNDSLSIHRYVSNHGYWSAANIHLLKHRFANISTNIQYDYNRVFFDSTTEQKILFTKYGFQYSTSFSKFNLSAEGQQILQNKRNGYLANSKLKYTLKDSSTISLNFYLESKIPSLLEQTLHVNGRLIWQNDFQNTKSEEIKIEYQSSKSNLPSFFFRAVWISDLIYLDSNLIFRQTKENIRQINIRGSYLFKFRFLRSAHQINLHWVQPDPAGWTGLFTTHDMMFRLKFFGRFSKIEFGPNLQIFHNNHRLGFHPLSGQYYRKDNVVQARTNFILGASIGILLNDFEIKIQLEQLDSFWADRTHTWVESYPLYDFGIRLGIKWKLVN